MNQIVKGDIYLPRNIIVSDNPNAKELVKEYLECELPSNTKVISREQANIEYSKIFGEYQSELEEDEDTVLISPLLVNDML